MITTLRISALYVLIALFAVSTFAQDRPLTGTVIDIDEGRGRLQIELDDDGSTRVTIETDAVSTTYYGFGTVIAGKPEIFTGSSGLSNVRLGDRINVRGPQRSEGVYKADRVTLLGRDIPASPTGVGQTRNPSSISTQTDDRPVTSTATPTRVEGTVRQVNEREGRLVLQTTDRRMITVRTSRTTPVWYRGQQYTVANLEVGDRIRVDYDPRDAAADDISARRIDVTASVQESGGGTTSNTVTVLDGRVVRVENSLDYVYVDDGRGEVRVDMRNAEDARGEIIRARDLRVGDRVEITGSYNRVGDLFAASTVRFETGADAPRDDRNEPIVRFGLVTLTGTFVETLEDASTLGFRDRETNQIVRLWAAEDFVVRTKGNTYTTVESLRVNDTAVVKAYRDWQGNLIAQTIRLRNR